MNNIQSSITKISRSRYEDWTPRRKRLALGMTEREAMAAGLTAPRPAQEDRRSDYVMRCAAAYGLWKGELKAYDMIAAAAAKGIRCPSQTALLSVLEQGTDKMSRATETLLGRLESAGLIRQKQYDHSKKIIIRETGDETWIVQTGRARRKGK